MCMACTSTERRIHRSKGNVRTKRPGAWMQGMRQATGRPQAAATALVMCHAEEEDYEVSSF